MGVTISEIQPFFSHLFTRGSVECLLCANHLLGSRDAENQKMNNISLLGWEREGTSLLLCGEGRML